MQRISLRRTSRTSAALTVAATLLDLSPGIAGADDDHARPPATPIKHVAAATARACRCC